jgi:uncharacterized protein YndB with AHSA1/START domain
MNHDDRIVVTTVVDADPATAFEIFTQEVDSWWKQGPKFRPSVRGRGVLHFEPGVGGRLLETYDDGTTFVFGQVKVWEPGQRLVFESFARAFQPGESTEVEVRFEPAGENTRVILVHRGWDRFSEDHPVKHGLGESAFNELMSNWWADLLDSIKDCIAGSSARKNP